MNTKTLIILSLFLSGNALAIDNNEYSQTNGIYHIYNPGHKYVVIMRHEQTSGLYTGRTQQEAGARAEVECRKMPGYCEFETCTGADGVWAARANSAEYTQDGDIQHTIGIVCGSPTMEAAIREAERVCRKEGGSRCKVDTSSGYNIAKIDGDVNEFGDRNMQGSNPTSQGICTVTWPDIDLDGRSQSRIARAESIPQFKAEVKRIESFIYREKLYLEGNKKVWARPHNQIGEDKKRFLMHAENQEQRIHIAENVLNSLITCGRNLNWH